MERIHLSHYLDVGQRLEATRRTLSPADLLLTKLQVVEVNEKDLKDVCALLADQPISPEGIDPGRIAEVLGGDWGWLRTCTNTLGAVIAYARPSRGSSTETGCSVPHKSCWSTSTKHPRACAGESGL